MCLPNRALLMQDARTRSRCDAEVHALHSAHVVVQVNLRVCYYV